MLQPASQLANYTNVLKCLACKSIHTLTHTHAHTLLAFRAWSQFRISCTATPLWGLRRQRVSQERASERESKRERESASESATLAYPSGRRSLLSLCLRLDFRVCELCKIINLQPKYTGTTTATHEFNSAACALSDSLAAAAATTTARQQVSAVGVRERERPKGQA